MTALAPRSLRDDGSSLKTLALVPLVPCLIVTVVLLVQVNEGTPGIEPVLTRAFVFWAGVDVLLALSVVVLFVGGYVLTAMADAVPAGEPTPE